MKRCIRYHIHRTLAFVLALAMAFSLTGNSVTSEAAYTDTEESADAVEILSTEITAEGYCGEYVTWTLYADGRMVIDGTGGMYWEYEEGDEAANVPYADYMDEITAVEIGDEITLIYYYAFYGCTNLTSVSFGENEALICIHPYAFAGTQITSIDIPSTCSWIGEGAFRGSALTSFEAPEALEYITAYTFAECTSLKSITCEEGSQLKYIYEYAFWNSAVETAVFQEGLTGFGSYTFQYTPLTEITIPLTVTWVGQGAFDSCTSLQTVHYAGTDEDWEAITISEGNDCLIEAYYGEEEEEDEDDDDNDDADTNTDTNTNTGSSVSTDDSSDTSEVSIDDLMSSTGSVDVDSAQTLVDLINADPDGDYVLEEDITLSGGSTISYFSGTLDGNGHTIYMEGEWSDSLFNTMTGIITDLNVRADVTMTDPVNGGLLTGWLDGGSVINCSISGSLTVSTSTGTNVASIAAGETDGSESVIEGCSSTLDITVTAEESAAWLTVGGICAYSDDTWIYDCSYNADIVVENLSSSNTAVSGITFWNYYEDEEDRSYCYDCSVDGNITVKTISGYTWVYGLDQAVSSVNAADITVTTETGECAVAGVEIGSNSTNDGNITVTATGSTENNVNVNGMAEVDAGANNGAVTASGEYSRVNVFGISGCSDAVNNGDVKAVSTYNYAGASGVYAAGCNVVNNGAVYAYSDSGSANVGGIYGSWSGSVDELDADAGVNCINYGDLTVDSENGTTWAVGIFYCTYSANYGSIDMTNASVITTKNGGACANGTESCYASENHGDVTVTVTGEGSYTMANARGCTAGYYVSNYGTITANSVYAAAKARGCVECSNSVNYGTVTATTEGTGTADASYGSCTAWAAGCADGAYCLNEGAVTAEAQRNAARAYGYYDSTSSASTGAVTAITHYFYFYSSGTSVTGSNSLSYAYNSTTCTVEGSGYSFTATGGENVYAYYFYPSSSCSTHAGFEPAFISLSAGSSHGCYHLQGYAQSVASTDVDTGTAQEQPEAESGDASVEVASVSLYDAGISERHRVNTLYYACGSFYYERDEKPDAHTWETTDCSEIYMDLELVSSGEISDSLTLTVTLPAGFSFSETEVESTRSFDTGNFSLYLSYELPKIYLLYSENYFEASSLEIEYTLENVGTETVTGTKAIIVNLQQVNVTENTANIVQYDTSLGSNGLTAYEWDVSAFSGSSETYSTQLAELSAILAALIENGGKEEWLSKNLIIDLRLLGFSCIEFNEETGSRQQEYVCATKKIIVDGEVKTLLLLAVQGTITDFDNAKVNSVKGWWGNLSYMNGETEHGNFFATAQNDWTAFKTYCVAVDVDYTADATISLITGHSRGAAVANLISSYMDDARREATGDVSNIYCYTFAAPNPITSVSDTEKTDYANIFNIKNVKDLVGFVPGGTLSEDGHRYMTTYGVNLVFGYSQSDLEKGVLDYVACAREMSVVKLAKSVVTKKGRKLLGMVCTADFDQHSMSKYYEAVKTYAYENYDDYDDVKDALDERFVQIMESLNAGSSESDSSETETIGSTQVHFADDDLYDTPAKKVVVNCPVDVMVLDADGDVVCRITDDQIEEVSDDSIAVIVYGDEKQLYLPDDEAYTIRIIGYGDGDVNCTVITMDEEGNDTAVYDFAPLTVTENQVYELSLSVGLADAVDESLSITEEDGNTYPAEEIRTDDALSAVRVILDSTYESDTVLGTGYYSEGDMACAFAYLAYANDISAFLGWYDEEGNLVSEDVMYWFEVTDQDVSLTAKYSDTGEIHVHSYEASFVWDDDFAATLTLTCTDCGSTQTLETDVTSEITTEATCAKEGVRTWTAAAYYNGVGYTDTKTEVIAATGVHMEGDAVTENAVDATCTEDGSYDMVVYCTVCGEELSRETVTVPAEDHDYDGNVCSVCGALKTSDVSSASVKLSKTSYTYTGSACKPTVTVKVNDTTLKLNTDYTVKYSGNTNAGTAKVTITGAGDYTGTATARFTIKAKSYASGTVSLSYTSTTYSGAAKKPSVKSVKVTLNGAKKTLKSGTDYTVSYKNNKAIGKASVVITLKGNYSGTIKKTFTIKPKQVTISSAKSSVKKKLTVQWKKSSGSVKYQIAYKKKGGSWKYMNVSASTYKKTLTGLSSGKYYYVKVRAYKKVDGTTYYGSWSSQKTVKVK